MTESPRATRADSEDGHWECSLTYYEFDTGFEGWAIYDKQAKDGLWKRVKVYPDTGQSAEEVLAQWEREQSDVRRS